ncbi:MAG: hypothetical protein NT075_08470 [Chloroflexi bacterium]|nr:hypothetical protein [Chloroflexota bacterium]
MSNSMRTDNPLNVKSWLLASLVLVSILFYAGIVRPWFMNWGATPTEQQMALPGDGYIPLNTIVSTQAITIHAPRAQVWAWLVQLGQQHGGFCSLGSYFDALWPMGYLFWLGLPSLIFVGATTWISWQLAGHHVNRPISPIGIAA